VDDDAMSRLNYMSDIEFSLLTIQEELACLERHAMSGGTLGPDSLAELKDCASRVQTIIEIAEAADHPTWETDNQARPEWLQPKETTIEKEQEQTRTRSA
jgi:hypothetical protein